MFSNVVLGVDHHKFEHAIDGLKKECNVFEDTDLTVDDLKELVNRFKAILEKEVDDLIKEHKCIIFSRA